MTSIIKGWMIGVAVGDGVTVKVAVGLGVSVGAGVAVSTAGRGVSSAIIGAALQAARVIIASAATTNCILFRTFIGISSLFYIWYIGM
jgi:hypothetical protein